MEKSLYNITLTDEQNEKKNQCIAWYKDTSRHIAEPVFPILGSAGTGKSTIISFIIDELGIKEEEIAYCAYTGMASLVLIKKGLPACTIHKLIYTPVEIYDKIDRKKKVIFRKKDKEELNHLKLIVVDEGSMVSEAMMDDLLTFGVPIIMLGDFFQLQPVGGKMNRFMKMTNYGLLDKPLRQALDNPIIWLSDRIRHGELPKVGNYDGLVRVYTKDNFPEEVLQNTDQIIAGKNRTCSNLNKFIRIKFKNIKSRYPVDGDKLICIKNNWDKMIIEGSLDTYLVNGLLGTCSHVIYDNKRQLFNLNFKPLFMKESLFCNLTGDKLVFDDVDCKDDNFVKEHYKDVAFSRYDLYSNNVPIDKFMFGDAITVYKMQGSQERHITYYDEMLRKDIYLNHFYTAVTRAEEELDIILK